MINHTIILRFIDSIPEQELINLNDEDIQFILNLLKGSKETQFVKDHIYHLKKLYEIRLKESSISLQTIDKLGELIKTLTYLKQDFQYK